MILCSTWSAFVITIETCRRERFLRAAEEKKREGWGFELVAFGLSPPVSMFLPIMHAKILSRWVYLGVWNAKSATFFPAWADSYTSVWRINFSRWIRKLEKPGHQWKPRHGEQGTINLDLSGCGLSLLSLCNLACLLN